MINTDPFPGITVTGPGGPPPDGPFDEAERGIDTDADRDEPLPAPPRDQDTDVDALCLSEADIEDRVDTGIAVLSRYLGADWHRHIDVDRLDMGTHDACVLGQLAPVVAPDHDWDADPRSRYIVIRDAIAPHTGGAGRVTDWAIECGFNLDPDDYSAMPTLTAMWRGKIQDTRRWQR